MKLNTVSVPVTLLLLAVYCLPALAEQSTDSERYQVDVLLFSRPQMQDDHLPPREIAPPDYSQARWLQAWQDPLEQIVLPPAQPRFWQGWHTVPADQQQLFGEAARLQKSSRYRLLAHFSWVQPAQPRTQPVPVRLQQEEQPYTADEPSLSLFPVENETVSTPVIDGSASLYQGNYLHLKLDLHYCKPPQAWPLSQKSACWHLVQDYRITPGRLYYYDHSHFGALARVRKLDRAFNSPDATP